MQQEHLRVPSADQFIGAFLGLAIGDALGRVVEGKGQPEIRAQQRQTLLTFRGYHDGRLGRDLPPGAWSDDTQQALVLAESLVACGGLHARDFADRLYALWRSGEARGYGRVYQRAMAQRDVGAPWDAVAAADDPLNGAAMRIAPLGLFYWFDPAACTDAAIRSSLVTHRHAVAVAGTVALAHAFVYMLTFPHVEAQALTAYVRHHVQAIDAATAEQLALVPQVAPLPPDAAFRAFSVVPDYVTPRGDGVSGLTSALVLTALYLFLHTQGEYLRAVEAALLLGGDTDSTAAVAGALCAAWRGTAALPAALRGAVEDAARLQHLATALHRASLAAAQQTTAPS
jgi:ADP-ribosyl-[dinitrogen reductase] hydrolase